MPLLIKQIYLPLIFASKTDVFTLILNDGFEITR